MAEQRKSILAEQENRFAADAEFAAVWKRCLPGLKQEIDPDKTEPAKLRAFFDAAAKVLEMYAKFDCPADPTPAADADVRAFEEKLLARVAESWPAERAALLSAVDARALCDSAGSRLRSAYDGR